MEGPLAWMSVVPAPTAVIGITSTTGEFPFGANVTLGCTCATDVLSELSVICTPPAGTAGERVRNALWLPGALIEVLEGEKLSESAEGLPTVTVLVSPTRFEAEAVIEAIPGLMPLMWTGVMRLALEMKIALGETVTLLVSLLVRLTKMPPGGTLTFKVTGNGA